MQKNKLVHEDIKAVCNSAAKKLVACGLVVAVNGGNIVNAQTREFDAQKQLKKELQVEESTAVGSVSNTANSQSNTVEQPLAVRARGPVASSTPVTQQMTPAQDQPANNSPIVASELTTESNEPKEKQQRNLSAEEVEAAIAAGKGNFSSWAAWCTAHNVAYSAEFFALDAQILTSLMDARVAEIDKSFKELKPKAEKKISTVLARYEHKPEDGEWKFTHDNYLNIDDASVQRLWNLPKEIKTAAHQAYALRYRLDYLRERIRDYNARLERGLFSFLTYSARYRTVETSLQPQTEEPSRYDIEQAPAYVEWATNEVRRLEALAGDMLQQLLNNLRADVQEQIDFEDRMRWFDPSYAVLQVMAEEDSLGKFFDLSRRTDRLEVDINRQGEEIRRNGEELAALQRGLRDIMQQNQALYQQPRLQEREEQNRPMMTTNDDDVHVTEVTEITEIIEEEPNLSSNDDVHDEPVEENGNAEENRRNVTRFNEASFNVTRPQLLNPLEILGNATRFNDASFF